MMGWVVNKLPPLLMFSSATTAVTALAIKQYEEDAGRVDRYSCKTSRKLRPKILYRNEQGRNKTVPQVSRKCLYTYSAQRTYSSRGNIHCTYTVHGKAGTDRQIDCRRMSAWCELQVVAKTEKAKTRLLTVNTCLVHGEPGRCNMSYFPPSETDGLQMEGNQIGRFN